MRLLSWTPREEGEARGVIADRSPLYYTRDHSRRVNKYYTSSHGSTLFSGLCVYGLPDGTCPPERSHYDASPSLQSYCASLGQTPRVYAQPNEEPCKSCAESCPWHSTTPYDLVGAQTGLKSLPLADDTAQQASMSLIRSMARKQTVRTGRCRLMSSKGRVCRQRDRHEGSAEARFRPLEHAKGK